MCLKVAENIFWVIFAGKLVDEGQYYLFSQKCFMVDRTKQPEGFIGISEKCVFTLNVCRVATGSNVSGFIRAIVVLQVLSLNLKSFQRTLQVELSVKVVLKSSL